MTHLESHVAADCSGKMEGPKNNVRPPGHHTSRALAK
eukprot:CAMPEP_0175903386 /NCGR_PEP_ID=MMETSP0108-20121206/3908_1 /TAXON_ID=195067 ORGANISM="Goniomonas pacifica, Strain CCMP1869" /NCGR_SAMPLE_ID=MMETSP0108 /ASSEMBLY_ACC=CAM_ASM_000204 /LENGTH=36 /DNA_ID= /DNA_START= /DNA_END= /DNA_ORIENTATION=